MVAVYYFAWVGLSMCAPILCARMQTDGTRPCGPSEGSLDCSKEDLPTGWKQYALSLLARELSARGLLVELLSGVFDMAGAELDSDYIDLKKKAGKWQSDGVGESLITEARSVRDSLKPDKVGRCWLAVVSVEAIGPFPPRHRAEGGGGARDMTMYIRKGEVSNDLIARNRTTLGKMDARLVSECAQSEGVTLYWFEVSDKRKADTRARMSLVYVLRSNQGVEVLAKTIDLVWDARKGWSVISGVQKDKNKK